MTKYIKYTWELSDNFTSKTGKLTFCWKKLNTWWQENRNSRLRGHPEAMSAIADIAETVYFTNEILKKRSLWKWRKKNLAVTIEIHLFCLLLANKAGILKLEPCLPICVSYICNPIVVCTYEGTYIVLPFFPFLGYGHWAATVSLKSL